MGFDSLVDNRFRLLIEGSPAGMVMVGRGGDIQFANAEAERMFGYPRTELIGKPIEILVPARLRKIHTFHRENFCAHPKKRAMGFSRRDLVGARRDGSEFPIEIGLNPCSACNELVIVATIVDITERREMENALTARAAELKQANEKLAQFAFVASNDLREPLNKIADFSEDLEKAVASADHARIVDLSQRMRESALCGRRLVDDLLTYSRITYGGQELELLDLRGEIQFALADLSKSVVETNTQVNFTVPAFAFMADRSQFARLMQNIISNAIKYRKPGEGAKVDITTTLLDNSTVRLAIADQGVGFEEEFAQTIFEPFAHPRSRVEYLGTGIELAICKAIADRHGWEISVKSRPGKGATFFFTIPILFASEDTQDV